MYLPTDEFALRLITADRLN